MAANLAFFQKFVKYNIKKIHPGAGRGRLPAGLDDPPGHPPDAAGSPAGAREARSGSGAASACGLRRRASAEPGGEDAGASEPAAPRVRPGVLRDRPGAAAQVQLCALAGERDGPPCSRGFHARADLRPRPDPGRDESARSRLRVGRLERLDRRERPGLPRPRGLQLEAPARLHRSARGASRARQPRGRDGGRELLRARMRVRPVRVGGDVRAPPQLGEASRPDGRLAPAGREGVSSLLLPANTFTPTNRKARTTGWAATSSPRA